MRDPSVHLEVIEKVISYAETVALEPCHLSFSPIKGPEGNIEYLLHLKKRPEGEKIVARLETTPETVVRKRMSNWIEEDGDGQVLYYHKYSQKIKTWRLQERSRLT